MSDVRHGSDLTRPSSQRRGTLSERPIASSNRLDGRIAQLVHFAEIGQISMGIVHEMNNLLTCLTGNMALLKERMAMLDTMTSRSGPRWGEAACDTDRAVQLAREVVEMREIMDDLTTAFKTVTDLSRNVKAVAHCGHERPQPTDLNECLEKALQLAGHEFKNRVSVIRDFAALPTLQAHPALLSSVFLNLLVNSAQAIDGEGMVRLCTRSDGRGVRVDISDSGRGIAPEHLRWIFRPFFTTKPVGVGLGLGLSLSRKIVERHGGSIAVASTLGKGTTFKVWLPVDGGSRAKGHTSSTRLS